MDHLGERLSALVDGELGHAERDRALSHLARCENCRFEAEMLRQLKRRLHGMDAPQPSTDFMGRLSALRQPPPGQRPPFGSGPGPDGRTGSRPASSSSASSAAPGGGRLGSSRPVGGGPVGAPEGGGAAVATAPEPSPGVERDLRRRAPQQFSVLRSRSRWGRTRYAVAGVSVAALALGTAFVAGGGEAPGPVVQPSLESFEAEHDVITAVNSLTGAAPNESSGSPTDTPDSDPGADTADTSRPR